ncbi:MAG: hypothetical protein WKG01_08795 [Kofleriaceae bacterium]
MTTGSSIYLVSACASGEEFIAAFRRYADRNGLFIPIAEPIPVGRKGRFSITLSDGGVMVEGDGEVISSARTPSSLHGRIGMTIRFSEPDPASKTILVELEKARLAMKPLPPSVPPRPAEIPATPRAVPPAPGGRIDLRNALAECVAIGNLDGLAVAAAKPSAKFTVPTIPPVAGGRPKAPTSPPFPASGSGGVRKPAANLEIGAFARANDTGPINIVKDSGPTRRTPTKTQAIAIVPPPMPAPPRSAPTTRPPPIPTEAHQVKPPISDTLTVPPLEVDDRPARTSDTVAVTPAPRETPMPLERGGPLSATMEVALGDITGANAALDPLDDVIPPPRPASAIGIANNEQSGVTTIAPPPQPEPAPTLQPIQQAPDDLLTTIRSPRPPQMDMLTTMRASAPPMPPILGAPSAVPEIEIGEPTDLTVIPSLAEAILAGIEPETEPTAVRVAAAGPPRPLIEGMNPEWRLAADPGSSRALDRAARSCDADRGAARALRADDRRLVDPARLGRPGWLEPTVEGREAGQRAPAAGPAAVDGRQRRTVDREASGAASWTDRAGAQGPDRSDADRAAATDARRLEPVRDVAGDGDRPDAAGDDAGDGSAADDDARCLPCVGGDRALPGAITGSADDVAAVDRVASRVRDAAHRR